MPIQPTGFGRVFGEIGLDFRTLRQCPWQNYSEFISIFYALPAPIADVTGLNDVRLVDAHSLLWLFSTLFQKEADGELNGGSRAGERVLGARERTFAEIKYSVGKTVSNSYGQMVEQKVKNKEFRMTDAEKTKVIQELLNIQEDRCAISGLPMQFGGAHTDDNMLASLDRIDSQGHYERGNLQLVCRSINFCKQASNDSDFRRLSNVVRGIDMPDD